MSGIAAIVRFDGASVPAGDIAAMTDAMAFRGPDGIETWHRGPVALGHCMLHTTAESLEETQPLANEDGSVVLVMDGYLHNHEELRVDLEGRGHLLRGRSDAELVLRAYETWGTDCADRIEGEFAFVIWDEREARLFCARDHAGLRPLTYHWDGSRLLVASDPAPILDLLPEQPPLNYGLVAEYAASMWSTDDETAWIGVTKLPMAHSMIVTANGPRLSQYWTVPTELETPLRSDDEYLEEYRTILFDSVRRASRSHRQIGVEVSGGLDSSAIFAVAHALLRQKKLLAPDIKGYTFDSPAGSVADEWQYVHAVEEFVGAAIEPVPFFTPELDHFERLAKEERDFPAFPNTTFLTHLQARCHADGGRVSLNGLGGDQWLDGRYFYYHQLLSTGNFGRLWRAMASDREAIGLAKTLKLLASPGLHMFLQTPRLDALRHFARRFRSRPYELPDWLNPEMTQEMHRRIARFEASLPTDTRKNYKVKKLRAPVFPIYWEQLSRQNARNGIEGRSPMMSRKFIEFNTTTPEHLRLNGHFTRRIHRKACEGLLPPLVLNRRSKAGFDFTIGRHREEIERQWMMERPANVARLHDVPGTERFLEECRNAEFGDIHLYRLWGVFVSLVMARQAGG